MKKYLFLIPVIIIFFSCVADFKEHPENSINQKRMLTYVKVLASDDFQGRKPFTIGEEKTTKYLAEVYKKIGLKPLFKSSYFQNVPMVQIKNNPSKRIELITKSGKLTLQYIKDYIVGTSHIVNEVKVNNSELVFVGYGITAPEYKWNDFKNVDVKGKIVLMLVNDPGFSIEASKKSIFKGKTMTYYGRWWYKFEEAARRGAKGVLVIHNTKAAGYGWQVLTNTAGNEMCLQSKDKNKSNCALTGWITEEAVSRIFKANKLDFQKAKKEALTFNFKPILLGSKVSLTIKNKLKFDNSKNVVGIVEGSTRKDEAIVYSAHWDHFGIGPKHNNDSIYNGAADNALAVACMLETAKAMAQTKPKRTVIFAAVTAEETGLLGSVYFAENNPFKPNKIVANLNYELLLPMGRMKDVTITGFGQSSLDKYVEDAAKTQNRYIVAEPFPENGMYYRSDHFSFARIGIPSLFFKGWQDSRKNGKAWAKAQINDYWKIRYHKPADEFDANADLSGCVEDAKLFFLIGNRLANEITFPAWSKTSEFRAVRSASMKNSD